MSGDSYRDGRVHIKARMCSTCIGRPGNLTRLEPGRRDGMVADATAEQSAINCHSTLYGGAPHTAVCRWFYDKHATTPLQIAARMGLIEEDE